MPNTPPFAEALAPLREHAETSAILLDIDGTLAPIVRHADDAHVPEKTRLPLISIARRYGLVACVSGRRAAIARRIVSLGSITYVGNHGTEVLRGGATEPDIAPEAARYRDQVQQLAKRAMRDERMTTLRIRNEDKSAIYAFHWRGAPDEEGAEAYMRELEQEVLAEGLHTHWGRKVLEIRPPIDLDKGTGVRSLLERFPDITHAMYGGDDRTDTDAFRELRALQSEGRLASVVCVGVRSDETPPEILDGSDVLVAGTEGMREVLEQLAAGGA